MAKLGDVCTVVSGTTPKSSCPDYWNGRINWVTPAELTDDTDTIFESQRKITELAVSDSGLKAFPAGTVLLSSRAPIGKVAIAGREMYCNQGFKNLICSDAIYNRYLFHFLKSKTDYLNSLGRGATFKEISKNIVEKIEIPLPPLEEQRQIASVLDKVTNLIAKRRAQLDKLDLLVKSRFVEMFGGINDSSLFPYIPIKEFTNVVSGATPNRSNSQYWDGGTIPWVKTTELRNDEIYDTEEKITAAGFENSSVKMVPAHTILIAMYGQGKTRGMTAYLQCQATTNQACACILPSKKVNQKYLWQYLIFSYEKLRNMAKGGNQPNLNGEIIKNFPVLLPPIEMQTKFSQFKEDIEKNKSLVIESLNALETLKASLMQQYFG